MGALAAMVGINMQQNTSEMSLDLYPNIAKSTPFLMGLFDLKVTDKKQGIHTTLYDYLTDYQRGTWWNYVFGFPFKVLGWLRSSSDAATGSVPQKIISLTLDQQKVLEALKNCMNVSVDKKTGMITLSATLQSAEISASLVDTLTSYMQDYIINFRTEKARKDLASAQELYDEYQQNYFEAQQKYADYKDRHQNTVSEAFRTAELRLQNDMNLAFTIYSQMAQQLQIAKIKVQDLTPVCKIIQPAVVPLQPSAPKKKMILMGIVFLTFVGACGWVLFGKEFVDRFRAAG
jgi:uncharacterized protein involved in exopolysaccharide biosynthesis